MSDKYQHVKQFIDSAIFTFVNLHEAEYLSTPENPNWDIRFYNLVKTMKAIGFKSNIIECYHKQPIQHPEYNFDSMCLLEFALLFQLHYSRKNNQLDDDGDDDAYRPANAPIVKTWFITLQNNMKITIRNTKVVVWVPYFKLLLDPENYK